MLDAALERSKIVRRLDAVSERLGARFEESRLREFGTAIADYVRASYCYRWLTAEPDPDVIVIDLRETYTVGPIIRLLEATGDGLVAGYAHSRIEPVGAAAAEAVRARPIRALGGVGLVCAPFSAVAVALVGSLSTSLLVGHLVALFLSAVALRSTHSLTELLESRPVTLLAAALEPPEPPESHRTPGRSEAESENETVATERTDDSR